MDILSCNEVKDTRKKGQSCRYFVLGSLAERFDGQTVRLANELTVMEDDERRSRLKRATDCT